MLFICSSMYTAGTLQFTHCGIISIHSLNSLILSLNVVNRLYNVLINTEPTLKLWFMESFSKMPVLCILYKCASWNSATLKPTPNRRKHTRPKCQLFFNELFPFSRCAQHHLTSRIQPIKCSSNGLLRFTQIISSRHTHTHTPLPRWVIANRYEFKLVMLGSDLVLFLHLERTNWLFFVCLFVLKPVNTVFWEENRQGILWFLILQIRVWN